MFDVYDGVTFEWKNQKGSWDLSFSMKHFVCVYDNLPGVSRVDGTSAGTRRDSGVAAADPASLK